MKNTNNWTPNILNIPHVDWTAERNRSEQHSMQCGSKRNERNEEIHGVDKSTTS